MMIGGNVMDRIAIALVVLCLSAALLGPAALAQGDVDEAWRRYQGSDGDEEARQRYWHAKKNMLRDTFRKAQEGTLEAPPAPGPEAPEVPPKAAALDVEGVRRIVSELFAAYEREDLPGFMALVNPDFHARDDSGNDYRYTDLPRALSDDFATLDHIRYTVYVGAPIAQADGDLVQVEVRWSRRAWSEIEAREWIVLDQRTVFTLKYSPNPGYKILRLIGDAIFALARRDGKILVDKGTLDGEKVEEEIIFDRNGVEEQTPKPTTIVTIVTLTNVSSTDLDLDDTSSPERMCGGSGPPNDIEFRCFLPGLFGTYMTAGIVEVTGQVGDLRSVTLAYLQSLSYMETSLALAQNPSDIGRTFAIRTDQGHFAIMRILGFAGFFYTLEIAFYRQS